MLYRSFCGDSIGCYSHLAKKEGPRFLIGKMFGWERSFDCCKTCGCFRPVADS